MAGFVSTAYLQKANDQVWNIAYMNGGALVPVFIALSSTLPTAAGGNVTEPNTGTNYGGYQREAFQSPTTASAGACSNGGVITFPTVGHPDGFVAGYYAAYNLSSGGTMIFAGTFSAAITCKASCPVFVPIGDITLAFTDAIAGLTVAGANYLIDILSGRTTGGANSAYISFYTTLPTNSQVANTNEAAYTSYARTSHSGKIAAATSANPSVTATNAEIDGPMATAGTSTIVGWGAGPTASGATALYLAGGCTSQVIGVGNAPALGSATNLSSLS
jgi:hypothetical protein